MHAVAKLNIMANAREKERKKIPLYVFALCSKHQVVDGMKMEKH